MKRLILATLAALAVIAAPTAHADPAGNANCVLTRSEHPAARRSRKRGAYGPPGKRKNGLGERGLPCSTASAGVLRSAVQGQGGGDEGIDSTG